MVFFVKMLLRLLVNFIPVDSTDLGEITREATDWALTVDPKDSPDNKTPVWLQKIARIADFWATKVALLFVYLWAYNALQNMFREDKTQEPNQAN